MPHSQGFGGLITNQLITNHFSREAFWFQKIENPERIVCQLIAALNEFRKRMFP